MDLTVSLEKTLQLPYSPPLGPRLSDQLSLGNGIQQDEAAVGRHNAKSDEQGDDFWGLRGVMLERMHQVRKGGAI